MDCIVTAGPSYESLDEVRRLTNFSTGSLGTELADFLTRAGHEVILLRGHYSTCAPRQCGAKAVPFTSGSDLARRLEELASNGSVSVFHAAAVCDFQFGKVWAQLPGGGLKEIRSGKINSREPGLMVELLPTPKILGSLRQWFPEGRLVGWKYEVEGGREAAVQRSVEQLQSSGTDLCVANGPAYGEGFGLVRRGGEHQHLPNRAALYAELIRFAGESSAKSPNYS